jgi:hypothetical protein
MEWIRVEKMRRYHSERCQQEMRGMHEAQSQEAADVHLALLKLHELMYYDLVLPTFIAAPAEDESEEP